VSDVLRVPTEPAGLHLVEPAAPAGTAVPADTGAPADTAARLRLSTTRLARRLRQEAEAGLTPSLLSALASIRCHGPLTLGALADHERVAPPSVTKLVGRLEAEGLVLRSIDPNDRRVSRVAITDRGNALVEDIHRRKNAWLAGRIEMLPAADQARLAEALDVLDHLVAREEP
jgi:DNA-binding MarR family transcriptional regulator